MGPAGEPHGSVAAAAKLNTSRKNTSAVFYNSLSEKTSCRTSDILDFFKNKAFVLRAGTRKRQPIAQLECNVSKCAGFWDFNFGYNNFGNSHSGVAIAVNRRFFGKQDCLYAKWPDNPKLQGRAGLLRIRTKVVDLALLVVYLPPSSGNPESLRVVRELVEVVRGWVRELPARTFPLLGLDATAHLGF